MQVGMTFDSMADLGTGLKAEQTGIEEENSNWMTSLNELQAAWQDANGDALGQLGNAVARFNDACAAFAGGLGHGVNVSLEAGVDAYTRSGNLLNGSGGGGTVSA